MTAPRARTALTLRPEKRLVEWILVFALFSTETVSKPDFSVFVWRIFAIGVDAERLVADIAGVKASLRAVLIFFGDV